MFHGSVCFDKKSVSQVCRRFSSKWDCLEKLLYHHVQGLGNFHGILMKDLYLFTLLSHSISQNKFMVPFE